MSPELQQQAASFLEATKQAGSNAAQFLQEQAPQYVSEVIAWQFWSSVIFASAFAALALAAAVVVWQSIKRLGNDFNWVGGIIFGTTAFFGFGAATTIKTMDAVKAKVAPRVVIMEQAAKLIGRK